MLPEEARIQALRLLKMYPYPGADVEGMMELLGAGYRMEFQHREVICSEDEPATCMYLLTYGKVDVIKKDFEGRAREVSVLHAPAVFGHMSMVDGSRRTATCTAEGTVAVVVIDRETYQQLITSASPVGRTLRRMLLSSLTDQLSRGNKRIRELTAGPSADAQTAAAAPPVTEEDISEISSELDGWRRSGAHEDEPTDAPSHHDADGPVVESQH